MHISASAKTTISSVLALDFPLSIKGLSNHQISSGRPNQSVQIIKIRPCQHELIAWNVLSTGRKRWVIDDHLVVLDASDDNSVGCLLTPIR